MIIQPKSTLKEHPTPIKYTSKTGKKLTIRPAIIEDAQDLINLKRGYIKDTESLPLTLKEYPQDLIKEIELIKGLNKNENSCLLVADYEGQLIGNIDLSGSGRIKTYHTSMIGMGISNDWQNQGVGQLLLKSILDWAKEHSKIELVWLDVYATNESGIHLYKKMGFIECGMIPSFFKEGDTYVDKIQMYRKVQ